MKRLPLIADRVLAAPTMGPLYAKAQVQYMRGLLMGAKRFVLDDDAARLFAQVVRDYPETAVTANEFAIPPFPVMYVEFPYIPFHKEINGGLIDNQADERVAYVYNGSKVYVFASSEDDSFAVLLPLEYSLNTPWTMDAQLQLAMSTLNSRGGLDKLFWGVSYNRLDEELRKGLRAQHSARWFPKPFSSEQVSQSGTDLVDSMAGDLRNAVMLLLFLNQTRSTIIEDKIPAKQAMIKNKASVFLSHSVVRLSMSPKERFVKLLGHSGVWRKEHDVRGHFCHDKAAKKASSGHAHDWQEVPRHKDRQWFCKGCQGLRWWRKDHRRGHREKGIVQTTYEVTG